jgi:hypothetical protein
VSPRLPRWLGVAALLGPALFGGCATVRAPIPNPDGLPPEALTLQYMLDRACLPYVQGLAPEDVIMRNAGLLRAPGGVWRSSLLYGAPTVGVGRTSCSIQVSGGEIAAYRAAIKTSLDRRLGAAVEPDAADFAPLPDRLSGCRRGIRYNHYEERGRFHLELSRAGCGELPPPPPGAKRRPDAPEQTVAVEGLIGLTPEETRQRLRISPPDRNYVTEVRLTGAAEIQIRDSFDMTRSGGVCTSDSAISFQNPANGMQPIYPRFLFRDGRLQDVQLGSATSPPAPVQSLDVLCRSRPKGDPADSLGNLVFAPWAAVAAAGRIPETIDRAAVRGELAKFRLGEQPPEDLQIYALKPPAGVEVRVMAPNDALITVDLGRGPPTNRPQLVHFQVVSGRIVAIFKAPDNFVPCWIEADRAFHCGDTAAPL